MDAITMTKDNSLISVLYDGSLLIIDFPYDKKLFGMMYNIEGAKWNEAIEKKWTAPSTAYASLSKQFGNKIIWKTNEELKESANALNFKEETLNDVLERVPKNIETPFMKIEPYDFQKLMVAWGITKKGKKGQIYGGLLADLMGLGKTIQALAFSIYLKHNPVPDIGEIKRVLIVCPATLKLQWGQEIARFTDESYQIIEGGNASSKKKAFEKRLEQYQRVRDENIFFTVVNYELLREKMRLGKEQVKKGRKLENKTVFGEHIDLNAIIENEYDLIIVDEAQRLRNPKNDLYKCFSQIQSPRIRLLMTGTPIEKDLQNIFPLMDYLSPEIFSSSHYDFQTRYKSFEDRFLIMGWNDFALKNAYGKIKDEFREVKGVKNVGLLNKLIAPYMLRRKTEDVKGSIPEVVGDDTVKVSDWDKEQQELYKLLQGELQNAQEMMAQAMEKNDEEGAKRAENEMNAMLMYMLEVCNTPELLFRSLSTLAVNKIGKIEKYKPFAKKALRILYDYRNMTERFVELRNQAQNGSRLLKEAEDEKEKSVYESELNKIKIEALKVQEIIRTLLKQHSDLVDEFKFNSPKLEQLLELVENVTLENEEKIVIFSKFEKMTQILYREIDKRLNLTAKGKRKPNQIGIEMYTGATPKTCNCKEKIQKEKITPITIGGNECPCLDSCNSRTKSAWFFQNNPNTRVIIATDAANYGVNLQSGKYLVNYDLPDSYSVYAQRNGRIRRLGSNHDSVYIYNLVLSGGIDERKFYTLLEQKDVQDAAIENNELEEDAIIRATASMNKSLINDLTKKKK